MSQISDSIWNQDEKGDWKLFFRESNSAFVINALPSLSLTTAPNEFILISTIKNVAIYFLNILVPFLIIYYLRPSICKGVSPVPNGKLWKSLEVPIGGFSD